jgi:hypothetical protein
MEATVMGVIDTTKQHYQRFLVLGAERPEPGED